jgi:putative CocE/NonD family hydrolase
MERASGPKVERYMTFSQRAVLLTAPFLLLSSALAQTAQYPNMPSEMPATVNVPAELSDYTRRVVMIPMRDGVKLNTVILIPKSVTVEHKAAIVLTRTPYSAAALTTNAQSTHLASSLEGYDNATDVIIQGGYIRVVQDVRGKYGSEGDYVMNRPFKGPLNPTPVDHSTDTYDTIDWLIKNVPQTTGKVGIIGISYDGFTTLAALINPHPALKVAVPMNPMVDGWRGDDWFHNGAFRQQNELYIYEQDGSRSNDFKWPTSTYDDYAMFMRATSAGNLAKQRGLDQMGFWNKVTAHPAYDAFWQEQAMDKLLAAQYAKQAPTLPIMLVHSLWDAEDIYGAMAVYKAIKPLDKNHNVYLSMGPWHHGGAIDDGSSLGLVKFPADPSYWWRQNVLAPFLAKYLKDDAAAETVPPVTVYQSGTDKWQKLQSWPKAPATTKIYLRADGGLGFAAPKASEGTTAYVSDPAKPVNYRARPSRSSTYEADNGWPNWLAESQIEQSGRPDVAVFTTEVLTAPVTIAGEPIANLVAATTGTDADWVVKLIDVYPDEVAGDAKMGGYQLMIAADIFRGRYRESLSEAHAIPANQPETYRFALPNASHVFLPGHRIMVQVQSSWFPLYDRNPQTFVPNIFFAQPADYKAATQTIFHSASQASFIELPIVQ